MPGACGGRASRSTQTAPSGTGAGKRRIGLHVIFLEPPAHRRAAALRHVEMVDGWAHSLSWRPSGRTIGGAPSRRTMAQRSSVISGKPHRPNAAAMVDFPAPEGPQKSTALPFTRTALACSTICRRWCSRMPKAVPTMKIAISPGGVAPSASTVSSRPARREKPCDAGNTEQEGVAGDLIGRPDFVRACEFIGTAPRRIVTSAGAGRSRNHARPTRCRWKPADPKCSRNTPRTLIFPRPDRRKPHPSVPAWLE